MDKGAMNIAISNGISAYISGKKYLQVMLFGTESGVPIPNIHSLYDVAQTDYSNRSYLRTPAINKFKTLQFALSQRLRSPKDGLGQLFSSPYVPPPNSEEEQLFTIIKEYEPALVPTSEDIKNDITVFMGIGKRIFEKKLEMYKAGGKNDPHPRLTRLFIENKDSKGREIVGGARRRRTRNRKARRTRRRRSTRRHR